MWWFLPQIFCIPRLLSLHCPPNPVTESHIDSNSLVAVGLSGILKAKQKLGVTFNFDKQDIIDFTKFSKMTMCRASEANSEKQS